MSSSRSVRNHQRAFSSQNKTVMLQNESLPLPPACWLPLADTFRPSHVRCWSEGQSSLILRHTGGSFSRRDTETERWCSAAWAARITHSVRAQCAGVRSACSTLHRLILATCKYMKSVCCSPEENISALGFQHIPDHIPSWKWHQHHVFQHKSQSDIYLSAMFL